MREQKPDRDELVARAAQVKLFVFDVDGVLSDGGLFYGPTGEALKRFDAKDGHAIVLARRLGLPSAVLSGRVSAAVESRGKDLGLCAILQGHDDKTRAFQELLASQGARAEDCAYMGDDINDLGPMSLAGLSACPTDAAIEVRGQALFVAQSPGGHGAVRELIELCLKSSGLWPRALELGRTGRIPP